MTNKTVGYSFWNYLSDVEKDTPGGGNFYIPDLVLEMTKRGWTVIPLQENRDWIRSEELGVPISFGKNFIPEKRKACYDHLFVSGGGATWVDRGVYSDPRALPDLDLLIVEWRWPIEGRNTIDAKNQPGFTPDLLRQQFILDHYHDSRDTTIVILDLDHKLTKADEIRYRRAHIFETSVSPRRQHTVRDRAFLPFDIDEVTKHTAYLKDPNSVATYIGNHYERDWAIDTFISPVSKAFPGGVKFVGNWEKYPDVFKEVKTRWPDISYEPRVVKEDFIYKYGPALTCPLLAKQEYYEQGFITPRILEALMYGCLPVGFTCHRGIEFFLPPELIVADAFQYKLLIDRLKKMSVSEYNTLINKVVPYLDIYSPKTYVDKLESKLGVDAKPIC